MWWSKSFQVVLATVKCEHRFFSLPIQHCLIKRSSNIEIRKQFSLFTKPNCLYQCAKTEQASKLEWTPVYRFPYIVASQILNRFKLYQTVIAVSGIPCAVIGQQLNLITPTAVKILLSTASLSCLTLYFITYYLRKLIGIIYIDNSHTHVKIAHLSFWGRRRDVIVPIKNIVPLAEGRCTAKDVYVELVRDDSDEILFLTLRFGKILKKEEFEEIFGNLELFYKF